MNKDTDVIRGKKRMNLLKGRLNSLVDGFRRAQCCINGAQGGQLLRVQLALLLGLFILGFIPQGFDGTHNRAVRSFDGGRRKPEPFSGLAYRREKHLGFVSPFDQHRFAPMGAVEFLDILLADLAQNDIRHGGAFVLPERGPLAVGAHHFTGGLSRKFFQCRIPVGDDMVFVDDESRDGAALDDLGLGPFVFQQFQFNFSGSRIAAGDDTVEAAEALLEQLLHCCRVVFHSLQFI